MARARNASQAEQQRLSDEFQQQDRRQAARHARTAVPARADRDRVGRVEQEPLGRGRQADRDRRRSRHHRATCAICSPASAIRCRRSTRRRRRPSATSIKRRSTRVPSIKSAADDFAEVQGDRRSSGRGEIQEREDASRSRRDHERLSEDARPTSRTQTLKPLVDKTHDAMSSVAQKRGLVLVVDRGNIIYGGTDITADVTSALK